MTDGIHKTKIAESLSEQCIAHRLRLMHRVVMGIYDEALRAEGVDLRIGQMNTLVVVIRDGTVKPSELCERMKIDASTVSRNVERLIARGLLPDPLQYVKSVGPACSRSRDCGMS